MTVTTSAAHRPPVADGSLLLGSAQQLRRDVLAAAEQAFRQYGDVVEFRAGPPGMRVSMYMLFHPDAAHRVLAGAPGNYRKDNIFYGEVRGAFGDGLLTSQDDEWQRQKRFLQPLFTPRRVDGYAEAMGEEVEDLLTDWHSRAQRTVDLHEEMTRLTLRIVGRILFGDDVSRALLAVRQSFEPLGEAVRRRSFSPVRLPRSWPTPINRRLATAQKVLHGVCDEIIARRRAASDRGTDLLGLLLDARDQGHALSDSEVRDQVLIFLLAGHETTSTALTFALHLLGQHPELQAQIRAEADALGGMPTAADAPALVQTTMALKEAMRLYPSAPMLGRRAVADDEICGYRIPAGSDVVLVPWVIHRHPQFWEEPTRFAPQRFTAERDKGRHRYAWMPFGGGPRGCIGQHFSMLEASIALASLIREFEFETPAGEPRYTNHITLRPTHAVTSRLTARRH